MLLSFTLAAMGERRGRAERAGREREGGGGKKKKRGSREEGGRVMRGQPPSTVGLPESERLANFMVNWATHLDS